MLATRRFLFAALTILLLLPGTQPAGTGTVFAEEGDEIAAPGAEPSGEPAAESAAEQPSESTAEQSAEPSSLVTDDEEYAPPDDGSGSGDEFPPGFGEATSATEPTTPATAAEPLPAESE